MKSSETQRQRHKRHKNRRRDAKINSEHGDKSIAIASCGKMQMTERILFYINFYFIFASVINFSAIEGGQRRISPWLGLPHVVVCVAMSQYMYINIFVF